MKKKLIALTIAAGMAAASLCGCGGGAQETSVVGDWKITKMEIEGLDDPITLSDASEVLDSLDSEEAVYVQMAIEMLEGFEVTFNEDGTGTASVPAYDTIETQWEETEDNVYDVATEYSSMEFTLEGSELHLNADGVVAIFEKN